MSYANHQNKITDSSLSPYDRGQQAGYADVSCDWNEKIEEYNPYPVNTWMFTSYDQGFEDATEYMKYNFPHI